MTQIVPLNKETHRALRVDGRASAAYGDNRRFVQVIVKEFPQLVVHYPILFSKDPQTGQFYCGVMLGFDEGENLFLEEWEEREFYRPLSLQRGPFYAHGPDLAIDLDDPRVELKLIEPVDVEVEFDDGTMRRCVGLYTIDQEVLSRLPDEVIVELFRRGYLRLIDYMIASLKQVPVLARKKNSRILKPTEGLAGAHAPALG
jgi:hypothetical protein